MVECHRRQLHVKHEMNPSVARYRNSILTISMLQQTLRMEEDVSVLQSNAFRHLSDPNGTAETTHDTNTASQCDVEKFRTLEAAEIRHFHSQPHLLPAGDQHYYCSGSLIKLLRSRPAYQWQWLRCVRKVRANMIQDQCRQATITTYFIQNTSTRKAHTNSENNNSTQQRNLQIAQIATTPDSQPTTRPNRTQQQQAMVTHFFPGRPPNSNSNNTNIAIPITTTKVCFLFWNAKLGIVVCQLICNTNEKPFTTQIGPSQMMSK